MKWVALLVLFALTGCVTDNGALNASASHRGDPDSHKQDCEHTEIAGASRTICY